MTFAIKKGEGRGHEVSANERLVIPHLPISQVLLFFHVSCEAVIDAKSCSSRHKT